MNVIQFVTQIVRLCAYHVPLYVSKIHVMFDSISSKIQHDNVLITEVGKVIYGDNVAYLSGCMCAEKIIYKNKIYLFAAIHTDNNTIEIVVYRDNVIRVLHTYEDFLNIVNIFSLSRASRIASPIVVCTNKGVLDIYDVERGRLNYYTSNQRILIHIECNLNSNTIGLHGYHEISKELRLFFKIDGFSNRSYWYGKKVVCDGVTYTYDYDIQGSITVGSHYQNGHIVIALSDGLLIVKMIDYARPYNAMVPKSHRDIETEIIPGVWLTVPKMLFDRLYAVNSDGVLIDISTESELVNRYFNQKEGGEELIDSCIHGMKVFNVRNTKSARKV